MSLINSSAFKASVDFLNDSEIIYNKIGNIRKYSLHYPKNGSNKLSSSGDSGSAELNIHVLGSRSEGIIKLKLEKDDNAWIVKKVVFYESNNGVELPIAE